MNFASPLNLGLTALVLLFAMLLARQAAAAIQRRRAAFVAAPMFARICGHEPTRRPFWKMVLVLGALVLLGIALARPVGGQREEEVHGQGLDLVVALDLSMSMQARDIAGYSRLDVAKALLGELLKGLKNDRIGLVVFAGESMIQCPLTHDYNSFLTFLERVDPVLLAKQGTDIAGAIETSLDRFDFTAGEQSRVVLLVSDGEDQQKERLQAAIDEAKAKKVQVFTVGIGSFEGGPIPVGQDPFGRLQYKVWNGETVISKLDDSCLKKVSSGTGARHFRTSDGESANKVARALAGLKRVAVKAGTRVVTAEWYQWPALAAFVLLLVEWLISERIAYGRERDHWLKRL